MTTQSDLKAMTTTMPESVDNLEKALSQIDGSDKEIDTQIGAVTFVCTSASDELLNYLTLEKVPYLSQNVNPTANLVVGPAFGVTGFGNTLSDWSVHAMVEQPQPLPPELPVPPADQVIYSTTINWDGDSYITTWMNDWAAANDYLHRPLTSGATYGLVPYKQNLTSASNILNENKSKLETALPVFEKYAG